MIKLLPRLAVTVCLIAVYSYSGAQNIAHPPLYNVGMVSSNGGFALAQAGAKSVDFVSSDCKTIKKRVSLQQTPSGITTDGKKIFVTTADADGQLIVISADGTIEKSIPVGHYPIAPIVLGGKILLMNQFENAVSEIDPKQGKVLRRVIVTREPKAAVASADGKYLFVANFLPAGQANLEYVAAEVSIINLSNFTVEKNIKLANGSNALRGMALTADGKYVLVSHNLGRFTVPTSQLQQGWMNTSAMSVIDVATHNYIGAVVLDDPDRGAAGIWGIQTTPENIIVTHSGTHDISVINYPKFIEKLTNYKGSVETLAYDLRFMYGLRKRIPLKGNGPRNFSIIDNKAYIPTYFADILNIYDLGADELSSVNLNANRTETLAQRGERIFNDAQYCFQNWQSCNGCHPGDGRTDGMNWDLMNDGIGNPKNCKSLLFSIQTPPSMISGIRASAEIANRKGFTHIQFYEIPEEWATWVDEYTKGLQPVPSPYLVNGKLSEKAERGRRVFEKFECDNCHSGIYYTDMKMYRIGEDIEFEAGWDTPTLREVWRTAPYLFDGRAATMRDVFEVHRHGITKKITSKEIDELVEYVNSL